VWAIAGLEPGLMVMGAETTEAKARGSLARLGEDSMLPPPLISAEM
jgi:hypothetical protein